MGVMKNERLRCSSMFPHPHRPLFRRVPLCKRRPIDPGNTVIKVGCALEKCSLADRPLKIQCCRDEPGTPLRMWTTALATAPRPPDIPILQSRICQRIANSVGLEHRSSCFDTGGAVDWDVLDRLTTISRRLGLINFLDSCFVMAAIYMDRIALAPDPIPLTDRNVCNLFATCAVIASKVLEDLWTSNKESARMANVSPEKLNEMEREVLRRLDWNVFIDTELYHTYLRSFKKEPSSPVEEEDDTFW